MTELLLKRNPNHSGYMDDATPASIDISSGGVIALG